MHGFCWLACIGTRERDIVGKEAKERGENLSRTPYEALAIATTCHACARTKRCTLRADDADAIF